MAVDADLLFPGLSGRCIAVRPELALLYYAARPWPTPADCAAFRRILLHGADWQEVLHLAFEHRLAGLLRARLQQTGDWPAAPPLARDAMEAWHRGARMGYLRLAHQLSSLLDACQSAGIAPIILKGAALAGTVYPNPALRVMGDIDVLVHPTALAAAVAVAQHLGYAPEAHYYNDAFNREFGYHWRLKPPAGSMFGLEVHWDLASRPERRNRLSATMLRRHAREAAILPSPFATRPTALVLRPEALLIYQATHAATEGHAFNQLIWLTDIAALLHATPAFPWDAALCLARVARASTATFVALSLASGLAGAHAPSAVLDHLRPPSPVIRALERTINPATLLDPLAEERRAVVKYLVVDSPAVTARLVRERFVPPPAVLRTYYGETARSSLPALYRRHLRELGGEALRKASIWLFR